MKEFFKKHSYDMVKMFLNQFAIAVFGFVLALASGKASNVVLRNVTGVASVIFYLFLLYTMTWDIGFADRNAMLNGKKPNRLKGALISLCANSINFILAFFIMLATLVDAEAINNLGGICATVAVFIEGMFSGLMANYVGGAPLNSYWFMYFIIPLPAVITCFISYLAGLYDKKMTSFFNPLYPESDREPKKKRKNDD